MNADRDAATRKNEEHLGEVYAFARRRGMSPNDCAMQVLGTACRQLGSSAFAVFSRCGDALQRDFAGPDSDATATLDTIENTVSLASLVGYKPSTVIAMTQSGVRSIIRVPFAAGETRKIAALTFESPIATVFTPLQQEYWQFLAELLEQCYGGAVPVHHSSEYLFCYQPICKARSRTIARAEALLRWMHPEHGILGPSGLFERESSATRPDELDAYAIESCAGERVELRKQGVDISLHVNISRTSEETLDVLARKSRFAEGAGIVVEIAGSAVYRDLRGLNRFVQGCRELGFSVGLGAAEEPSVLFPALSTLPIDFVKLSMHSSQNGNGTAETPSFAIRGAIQLAKHRNVSVIIDHVETESDVSAAGDLGADYLQGYAVAPPMTRHDLIHWSLHRGVRAATTAE
ncbi:MAG: EAL domain-containing protein [Candidatus Eremiobacteraeota bacterium]|nr:EAL domain-containing protein [Candidatus Eremiobacteraeota bacterium]